jgi:hypothetical protein
MTHKAAPLARPSFHVLPMRRGAPAASLRRAGGCEPRASSIANESMVAGRVRSVPGPRAHTSTGGARAAPREGDRPAGSHAVFGAFRGGRRGGASARSPSARWPRASVSRCGRARGRHRGGLRARALGAMVCTPARQSRHSSATDTPPARASTTTQLVVALPREPSAAAARSSRGTVVGLRIRQVNAPVTPLPCAPPGRPT